MRHGRASSDAAVAHRRRRGQRRAPRRRPAEGVRRPGRPADGRLVARRDRAPPACRARSSPSRPATAPSPRRRSAAPRATSRSASRSSRAAPTRSASVRNALAAAGDAEAVVVHDAARPLATPELFTRDARRARRRRRGDRRRARDRHGQGGGAGRRRRRARTTARGCGRSRRRRRSARDVAAARARRPPTTCSPRRPTTPGSSSAPAARVRVVESPRRELQGDHAARPARRRGPAVLTDYHVHLRPDDEDTPPERYFTAANAERYREAAEERGIAELGVAEHIHRFTQALEVWQHPWWRQLGARRRRRLLRASCARRPTCGSGSRRTSCAGREDRIAAFLDAREWDYVSARCTSSATPPSTSRARVGARLGPRRPARRGSGSATSRRSPRPRAPGLYDIMAHPDLVKVWGSARPAPERDPRHYYEPAVEAMLEAGRGDGGVDRRAAQAGRRALPGAGAAGDGGRRRAADRALERRARARPARLSLRRRAWPR